MENFERINLLKKIAGEQPDDQKAERREGAFENPRRILENFDVSYKKAGFWQKVARKTQIFALKWLGYSGEANKIFLEELSKKENINKPWGEIKNVAADKLDNKLDEKYIEDSILELRETIEPEIISQLNRVYINMSEAKLDGLRRLNRDMDLWSSNLEEIMRTQKNEDIVRQAEELILVIKDYQDELKRIEQQFSKTGGVQLKKEAEEMDEAYQFLLKRSRKIANIPEEEWRGAIGGGVIIKNMPPPSVESEEKAKKEEWGQIESDWAQKEEQEKLEQVVWESQVDEEKLKYLRAEGEENNGDDPWAELLEKEIKEQGKKPLAEVFKKMEVIIPGLSIDEEKKEEKLGIIEKLENLLKGLPVSDKEHKLREEKKRREAELKKIEKEKELLSDALYLLHWKSEHDVSEEEITEGARKLAEKEKIQREMAEQEARKLKELKELNKKLALEEEKQKKETAAKEEFKDFEDLLDKLFS